MRIRYSETKIERFMKAVQNGRVIANAARTYDNLSSHERALVDAGKHHLLAKASMRRQNYKKKEINPITGWN